MQKMCRKERREVEIPLDLIQEILYRLRSDDLLNFKLVSKDWERLISSPGFIQKHLERSNEMYDAPRIIVPSGQAAEILDCSDINITTKTIPWCLEARFLGSCDGLVLYYDTYTDVIGALNLSTGKYEVRTTHPSIKNNFLNGFMICSWFGHHPSTGEYVLVLASLYESNEGEGEAGPKPKRVMFDVHSLSCNDNDSILSSSTKELDWDIYQHTGDLSSTYFEEQRVGHNFCHIIGAFLQGRVHCPVSLSSSTDGRVEILAYDFETNDIIRMPTPLEHCYALLGVVQCGLLAALDRRGVWVLEEESWRSRDDVDLDSLMVHASFCPNGDIVSIDDYDRLTIYPLQDNWKASLLKAYGHYTWRTSIACIDSLVSPAMVFNPVN